MEKLRLAECMFAWIFKQTKKKSLLIMSLLFANHIMYAQVQPAPGNNNVASQILQPSNFDANDCKPVGIDNCYSPAGMLNVASWELLRKPYFSILKYKSHGQQPVNEPPSELAYDKTYFIVRENGFTGVGIHSPFTKLNLHNGIFTISEDEEGHETENSVRWELHGTHNAFAIRDQNLNKFRFWINKNNGFVGIGTTSPSERLQVEGNIKVNGNEVVNGNATVNGNEIINGNVTIQGYLEVRNGGTTNFKIKNNGYVRAREIQVDLGVIPDYVFKEDYELMSLAELKKFVEANKHLPNVKSEKEFKEEGSYALGEMNLKLLEKVEELTLYILDLQEQINKLKIK